MTLAQLSITVALLGGLGLIASRIGLSAIPAYLLAGLLLGPHEPRALSIVEPSEVTDFVAEIFLLFFLGLEFTLGRIARSSGHVFLGGAVDVLVQDVDRPPEEDVAAATGDPAERELEAEEEEQEDLCHEVGHLGRLDDAQGPRLVRAKQQAGQEVGRNCREPDAARDQAQAS